MEFQLSYFKSWKMMLWKCCTQYGSKFGKLSSGHRTGKGQFSFQSQRRQCQRMLKLQQNCTQKVMLKILQVSSVQFSCSVVSNSATTRITARQASLSITISRSSLRLTSVESMMPSSHLILGHALLLLPPIPPSTRVFSNESTLHMRWPKYWSFSFSISPSNEHTGLVSFRMDWLDLLAVQGTLKSLLQHHSSEASILQCSAFFIVQLSHPYMTTGKP